MEKDCQKICNSKQLCHVEIMGNDIAVQRKYIIHVGNIANQVQKNEVIVCGN